MNYNFSTDVMKRIEEEKNRREKRNENITQSLFLIFCTLAFIASMFLLNRYFFHIKADAMTSAIKGYINDFAIMFRNEYVSRWSIIGVNTVILILLEQLLSKKFSKKIK
ncbi:MAG: hypothetical protein A2X18_12205 [Bacteroidetes bacterium GWF2_40_14]|nr:MAG: hypothetical protein A2X18_12205 [Bacteroidetes bacterium GWF2_40_14]